MLTLYELIGRPVYASWNRYRRGRWYRYIIPRRLTLKSNPAIYKWLWWNFSWSKDVKRGGTKWTLTKSLKQLRIARIERTV